MKRWFILILVVSCLKAIAAESKVTQVAYLGAQGGGKYTSGGRGGKVLYVTSLEDNQSPGTLRWAVAQEFPRIILFQVAGTIELKRTLFINHPNITIAGQTAPGDGVCIKHFPVSIRADNVVIQFVRFRMGDTSGIADDALKALRRKNILIDHCSMSWSTDECASFYDNENFTLQWSILSESLRQSVHAKGDHGYAGIWGGNNATFHHNLIAHHDSRNPRFSGSRFHAKPENENVELINNVIYNWGSNSGYGGEGGQYNIIGNYYKPGPATLSRRGPRNFRIFAPNSDVGNNAQKAGVWGRFYVSGNVMHGNQEVTDNNWLGVHVDNEPGENQTREGIMSLVPFKISGIQPKKATVAFDEVLLKAGASLQRDLIDERIVRETREGTFTYKGSRGSQFGLIDSQTDVGGWPVYSSRSVVAPKDTDGDGIPDKAELEMGLNLCDPSDGQAIAKGETHTHLEIYLFNLVKHLY